jgi:hypothetical protein
MAPAARGTTMLPKLKHDPIEDDPAIRPLLEAAFVEATEIKEREWKEKNYPPDMKGKAPGIYKMVTKIMLERHGIEWKDPMEMNPGLFID